MSTQAIKRTYWLATALLLGAHFAGWPAALPLAISLTAAQTGHLAVLTGSWRSLAAQVRAAYMGLLLLGLWPPIALLHVVQFAGVCALLAVDYCLLARLLLLLPWNRPAPLSLPLVRWILLSPPVPGALVERVPEALRHGCGTPPPIAAGNERIGSATHEGNSQAAG